MSHVNHQPVFKILEPATAEEIKNVWLARYGTEIRLNVFLDLLIFPLVVMIDYRLISSFYQMIATCMISFAIMVSVILFNTRSTSIYVTTREGCELIACAPYFLLVLYFILQNIFLSKNNQFGVSTFLVFYLCLLISHGTFAYLRHKATKLSNRILLLIWNILAISKLFNVIDNSTDNNQLSVAHYILANFVIFFSQVK